MDEMEELRRANPVRVEDAAKLVGLSRAEVAAAFADEEQALPLPDAPRRKPRRPSRILGAAAAVLIAVVAGVTIADQLSDDATVNTTVAAPTENTTLVTGATDWTFDRNVDLLAVHLDWADRSDAHASVAAREAAVWFDLDAVVLVDGKPGHGNPGDRNTVDATDVNQLMDLTWGEDWIDGGSATTDALDRAADHWLATLDAGGRVFVADGGSTAFTADLVRRIQAERPGLDPTAQIRIVQNQGADTGASANRTYLDQNTTVVELDGNRAAVLSRGDANFEADMLAGCHETEWRAAFDYLPADQLGLADTVLVLDILGVGIEQVSSASDFASFFVGDQPDMKLRDGA